MIVHIISLGDDFMYYKRLRDMREDHDLRQKEIASILKIDQRVYSNYETGKREIPLHLVMRLAKYYDTSIDYLVGMTDIKSSYKKSKAME